MDEGHVRAGACPHGGPPAHDAQSHHRERAAAVGGPALQYPPSAALLCRRVPRPGAGSDGVYLVRPGPDGGDAEVFDLTPLWVWAPSPWMPWGLADEHRPAPPGRHRCPHRPTQPAGL